jgi:hypothetical protein
MGSYVTFKYYNQEYQSFIVPYSIKRLHVSKDSEKRTIIAFSEMANIHILNEDNNQWCDILTLDHTKVFVDTTIKKGMRSTTTYRVLSIERNKGVRINSNILLALEDVDIKDLTTIRRPFNGLCNFGLGGTWKNALVIRDSGELDVLYDDGDIEKDIPKSRFIYFDAPRNDYQMNMFSEGKLSILIRQIEHFRTTG